MCGIEGIVSKLSNQDFPLNDLKRMTISLEHRGPDSSDIFISQNVGFGHTRLSIMDLTEKGSQPLSYLDKYIIVFNDKIYNCFK